MKASSDHLDRTAVELHSPVFEPCARFFPVREAHQTQIGRGVYEIVSRVANVRDLWIFHTKVGPLCIGHVLPHPLVLAFLIPVSSLGECRFNGHVATGNTIYINSGFDGYMTRGQQRDYINVTVMREQFVAALAALHGVDPDELSLHDGAIELPPLVISRLRRLLAAIIRDLVTKDQPVPFGGTNETADCVFQALLEAYLIGVPDTSSRVDFYRKKTLVARRAEDHFMEAGPHPVSLADLCAAALVSKSVLYDVFQDLYGEAPLAYFHKRRLMRARTALITKTSEDTLVKGVALSLGVSHLGRFSRDYRTLFGETPSATLSRVPAV